MGGPFAFLAGIFSLGASAGISLKEQADLERKNREFRSHKYSSYIQADYDFGKTGEMVLTYDFDKIKQAIKKDYPNMSNMWISKITQTAIAKRMMEEETDYEYRIPEEIQNAEINLDKYATDEFKREKYGAGILVDWEK